MASELFEWSARMEAHRVGHYEVIGYEMRAWDSSERGARMQVLEAAYARGGTPWWRPYMRESWKHATAVRA